MIYTNHSRYQHTTVNYFIYTFKPLYEYLNLFMIYTNHSTYQHTTVNYFIYMFKPLYEYLNLFMIYTNHSMYQIHFRLLGLSDVQPKITLLISLFQVN